jgi:REP element-mobilizing transposase RayT
MSKNKLQHVAYECKYHIVLVPKYRYKIFTKDVKVAVKDEIIKLCIWLKIESENNMKWKSFNLKHASLSQ